MKILNNSITNMFKCLSHAYYIRISEFKGGTQKLNIMKNLCLPFVSFYSSFTRKIINFL